MAALHSAQHANGSVADAKQLPASGISANTVCICEPCTEMISFVLHSLPKDPLLIQFFIKSIICYKKIKKIQM